MKPESNGGFQLATRGVQFTDGKFALFWQEFDVQVLLGNVALFRHNRTSILRVRKHVKQRSETRVQLFPA